jgi:hypothetical protein
MDRNGFTKTWEAGSRRIEIWQADKIYPCPSLKASHLETAKSAVQKLMLTLALCVVQIQNDLVPQSFGDIADAQAPPFASRIYRNTSLQTITAVMRLTISANRPEKTAWRAFLIPTAPKYTAKT